MRSLVRDELGAAAIEYAFVLPALFGFAIGVMDLGRLVWTQVTLDRAVQAAARCASVNATKCANDTAIQTYAASSAWGMTVPSSIFTTAQQSCGVKVQAQLTFRYTVPWPIAPSTVKSAACYPKG
jgi:Flp pilus assembly protein TadG